MSGKCALGVLACESGDPSLKLNKVRQFVDDVDDILHAYGVTNEEFPYLDNFSLQWDFEDEMRLSKIIVNLNDEWKFTFKEIAEFLEVTFDL